MQQFAGCLWTTLPKTAKRFVHSEEYYRLYDIVVRNMICDLWIECRDPWISLRQIIFNHTDARKMMQEELLFFSWKFHLRIGVLLRAWNCFNLTSSHSSPSQNCSNCFNIVFAHILGVVARKEELILAPTATITSTCGFPHYRSPKLMAKSR